MSHALQTSTALRFCSLALAALLTTVILAGIDSLAVHEAPARVLAQGASVRA